MWTFFGYSNFNAGMITAIRTSVLEKNNMVYDCGSCMVKYILCGFNFIIFMAGSIVLAIGAWLAIDKNSFIGLSKMVPSESIEEFTQPGVIDQASYLLIAIGGFMFLVSFLGYCGALRESQCMLTTYGILLLIILAMEITAGCLAMAYKSKAEHETKQILKSSLENYYADSEKGNAVTVAWDQLQISLKCCGVNNYIDYEKTPWYSNQSGKQIPESCCVLNESNKPLASSCTTSPSDANSYFNKGCYHEVISWLMTHLNVVIATAAVLGAVEILGILFSFCLAKSITGYSK